MRCMVQEYVDRPVPGLVEPRREPRQALGAQPAMTAPLLQRVEEQKPALGNVCRRLHKAGVAVAPGTSCAKAAPSVSYAV